MDESIMDGSADEIVHVSMDKQWREQLWAECDSTWHDSSDNPANYPTMDTCRLVAKPCPFEIVTIVPVIWPSWRYSSEIRGFWLPFRCHAGLVCRGSMGRSRVDSERKACNLCVAYALGHRVGLEDVTNDIYC